MQQFIVEVAVDLPFFKTFDYLPIANTASTAYLPGLRVSIPFARRTILGIVLATKPISQYHGQLKAINAILDATAYLNADILQLCQWLSNYYCQPIGPALHLALPPRLRKLTTAVDTSTATEPPITTKYTLETAINTLNAEQQHVVNTISANPQTFTAYLLYGITGSGKTEVYMQVITQILCQQQRILYLLPEISLTPQTTQRLQQRFNTTIAVLHSRLTSKARNAAWDLIHQGQANIIVGTRSALFTPITNLGLIIVDEEHDASFKQQDGLRYSARDLAVLLAKLRKIPIILGSATPALTSVYNGITQKYKHLSLTQRATGVAVPKITVLDMCKQPVVAGISQTLLPIIQQYLERQQQILFFLNRRGYAPVLLCHDCGIATKCTHCDAYPTYHHGWQKLCCHHCGTTKYMPKQCAQCHSTDLRAIGYGTEQIEEFLQQKFANYPIIRIDRDTTSKKDALTQKLAAINATQGLLLIGTQMLAKGHHFANLALVVVVDVDAGLFSSDFHAHERLVQLVLQVAGRAGREQAGAVILQTHQPEHPLLIALCQQDYWQIAQNLLIERQQLQLPPYTFAALIRAQAHNTTMVHDFLNQLKQQLLPQIKQREHDAIMRIMGPVDAPLLRKQGVFRAQLLLLASKRTVLQHYLKLLLDIANNAPLTKKVLWNIDVDPIDMG